MADVAAAERRGDPPRLAAERGDLPDRAVLPWCGRRRIVDEGTRIRRPPRLLVVGIVTGDLQGRASGQQPEPDLTLAAGSRHERDGLAVRRNGRRLLHPDEIGETLELHIACGRLGRRDPEQPAREAGRRQRDTAEQPGKASPGDVERRLRQRQPHRLRRPPSSAARHRCHGGGGVNPSRDTAAATAGRRAVFPPATLSSPPHARGSPRSCPTRSRREMRRRPVSIS